MNTGLPKPLTSPASLRSWSWWKKSFLGVSGLICLSSSFLFFTPPGTAIREKLAESVIITQHRDWAWMFVGAEERDRMVAAMLQRTEEMGEEKLDLAMVQVHKRSIDEIVKIEDISGKFWVGKKMYIYDPKSIRVVTPAEQGQGERITSMVQRTGAVAGINGGGFIDPDGLGNGFAPMGFIFSGGELIFTDQDGSVPQHTVGFTKEGQLIVGKYSIDELIKLHISDGVFFYPRVIANGKPLITEGDGGQGRAPRTAIGQKADGTVIFIVIDGRQTHSIGATLREVQDLLLEEGCVNAGFLDGGASSEMVYNGELITKPSSRYGERRLPSAFLVFDDANTYKPYNVWEGLTKIDPGGAATHPEYQAELKNKGQQSATAKPSTTPTVKPSTQPEATAKPKDSAAPTHSQAPGSTKAPLADPPASKQPGTKPTGSPEAGGTTAPTPEATAKPPAATPPATPATPPAATPPPATAPPAQTAPPTHTAPSAKPGGLNSPGTAPGASDGAAK
ncbi:hypothetical protein J31TS4_24650 [Paenibacillus sp. J31TS4]|uniref:phosphodiester glycosidase family protein n=1 Tax=Paenibacillus sp. J31TS4 TaxID=2807195 RepID=UPI001B0743E1|nr:phosphodiester glycosidase family protein [Paenibacillus sp. J31TS4]GIP39185.1 hypothetical protein J31TS4_24650 [Paenibacillus sp. J31TS4]